MKKYWIILMLFLLAGCGKESIETTYANAHHNEIAEKVLSSDAVEKKKADEIFKSDASLDVYLNKKDETMMEVTLYNNMDYYFTGEVEFDFCEYKVNTTGLAPYGYTSAEIECPNYIDGDEAEFRFSGKLYERNADNDYDTGIEIYYYEDNEDLFDYVLDLDKIQYEDMKKLTEYLYTESVLMNYEYEMTIKVYPIKPYKETYNAGNSDAWIQLDEESLAGKIWLDANSDFAEIYDADGVMIERINFR